nr:translation initiation factor IF-2-like [Taeniopygia guttata]
MLTTTSYAVSFLMVAVYAYESHRTVLGGRARPPAALQVRAWPGHSRDSTGERRSEPGQPLSPASRDFPVLAELRPPLQPRFSAVLPQERSRCLESAWRGIPYVLAWWVPAAGPARDSPVPSRYRYRPRPGLSRPFPVPVPARGSHPSLPKAGTGPGLSAVPSQGWCRYRYRPGALSRPFPRPVPVPVPVPVQGSHPSLPEAGAGTGAGPGLSPVPSRGRCRYRYRPGTLSRPFPRLVPAVTLLAQLLSRGTSAAAIAPVVPRPGSNDTFSLYCSSCLLLIRPSQDICSQSGGGRNAGLEEKIILLLYLLLVLGCCSLLYRRVRLRCRGNAALPLLSLDRDGGFGGRSGRSVSKASLHFQLVFLLCWTPGKARGVSQSPAGSH